MANTKNKTIENNLSVNKFIEMVENPRRKKDAKELIKIMKEITGKPAKMWGTSIIGFGKCHYKYDSGHEGDMPLVGFSPRKANLVLYIMLGFGNFTKELEKLGKHKIGKSCLYVNRLDSLDEEILKELIKRSYEQTKAKYSAQ